MVLEVQEQRSTGWFAALPCCSSCHLRKQGCSGSGDYVVQHEKRVLVLGKSQSGKSRMLACLNGSGSGIPADKSSYVPTHGTAVSRVVLPPVGVTLIEVGGTLREFWHRSIDSKLNGIWYLVDDVELSSGDFSVLTGFLTAAREALSTRRLPILISASSSVMPGLVAAVTETGVSGERVIFSQISLSDRSTLTASLDMLKLKLIQ